MKNDLILLVIAATAAIFISWCVATGQATASHRKIMGKTISIKSGRWFEDCDKWESSDKINISFSSSKPVRFSVHYRQRRSSENVAVVDESLTESYEGSIAVQNSGVYCFMWYNDNFEDIKLKYDMGVGK